MADPSQFPAPEDNVGEINAGGLFACALNVPRPSGGESPGWTPPSVADLQRALPQYEIIEMLGRGGMGAVYKGTQRSLDRFVAIKILPPGIVDDHDVHYAERFKHEAQALAHLDHPGIVAVHDAGETADGLLYFVMDYIEGTDVQQMIAQGPLPPEHALAIAAHVCDALGFAHESGIVHRDIKPANIMVDKHGRVKVADFGLAKVTTQESGGFTCSGLAMGTPDFIAPEVMTGGANVDHRADLYAVGVMLYAMLTGEIPRGRFALPSTRVAGLDPRFDAIVDKAMRANREQRYASAAALRTDLDYILSGPIPVAQPAAVVVAPRRGKGPLLIAAAVLLALVAGGWSMWKGRHPGAPHAQQAPEPGALKLWDAAEKIPQKPGFRWEDNAVRLDEKPLRYTFLPSRDAILRADVRMNREAHAPQLNIRVQPNHPGGAYYSAELDATKSIVRCKSFHSGKPTELKAWPLPRTYGPDEWLRLELRAIGDEITVSADGKALGTVHDTSHPDAGDIQLFALAAGYFRNIVYVPLDKPGSDNSATAGRIAALAANPANWVDRLHTRKWEAPWTLDDGVLKTTNKTAMSGTLATMEDGAIRVRVRADRSKGTQLQLILRSGPVPGVEDTAGLYQFQTTDFGTSCSLYYAERRHKAAESETREKLWIKAPVPRGVAGQAEVEWEFRAVGDEFSAWANGQFVASTRHTRVPRGTISMTSDLGLDITKVETIDFGAVAAVPSK